MEAFLRLNGHRIQARVDAAEDAILRVAAGRMDSAQLEAWLEAHQAAG
jgi:prophage maintenance system killer protein